jgi:hypothetical protein
LPPGRPSPPVRSSFPFRRLQNAPSCSCTTDDR